MGGVLQGGPHGGITKGEWRAQPLGHKIPNPSTPTLQGAAAAKVFATHGAKVVVSDIDVGKAEAVAQGIACPTRM